VRFFIKVTSLRKHCKVNDSLAQLDISSINNDQRSPFSLATINIFSLFKGLDEKHSLIMCLVTTYNRC